MLKATFSKNLPASTFAASIEALKNDHITIMSEVNCFGKTLAVGSNQSIMILIGVIAGHGYANLESVFEV